MTATASIQNGSAAAGADPARAWLIDRFRTAALWAVAAANILFPAALWLTNPRKPWRAFEGEASPINTFSSIQCAVLGLIALGVFLAARTELAALKRRRPHPWPWLIVSLGFFFLSLDEAFELHERAREEFFKPRGVMSTVPHFKNGDVMLLIYVLAGAALCFWLYADLKRYRRSLFLFVGALALIGAIALQDSLNFEFLTLRPVRHVQVLVEEIGEVWAQALFAISMILVLSAKLRSTRRTSLTCPTAMTCAEGG